MSGPLRADPWPGRILVRYGSRIDRHRPIAGPIRGCRAGAFEPGPMSWQVASRALCERGRLVITTGSVIRNRRCVLCELSTAWFC